MIEEKDVCEIDRKMLQDHCSTSYVYGSDCWATTGLDKHKMAVAEMRKLR